MMGGTISVQSKKHKGTTFTVDIPLKITDKECNKSDTGFSEKVNLTGVNVLLAEDNELNAEIATVQLEEFGMNVERAVDGKNAVEIFRNHPEGTFDVILMDITNSKSLVLHLKNLFQLQLKETFYLYYLK